jgi:hypothetical protein
MKAVLGPSQSSSVQLSESSALEFVSNDGDLGRIPACILMEACNREEQVLKRVQSVIFRCHTEEVLSR